MTDKKLLELAAKAAGLKIVWFMDSPRNVTGMPDAFDIYSVPLWNPLTDDGDALRLAVKLMLDVTCHEYGAMVEHDYTWSVIDERSDDPYAATRRAIVRAAAEIGKEKENEYPR